MAYLSWHDRYLLGHPEVDAQHRKLFELVGHFDDVVQMGMPEELGRIMDDLILCASDHFSYEEEWMEQVRYPGRLEHRRMHQELIQQLEEMTARMKAGGHLSMKSFVRFLVDWLTNHIMREDRELKPYIRKGLE